LRKDRRGAVGNLAAQADETTTLSLGEIQKFLRRDSDRRVLDIELIMMLRLRGWPHAKIREELELSEEDYRRVKRRLWEAITAATLELKGS
jgi:hypothetical protein